MSLNLNAWRPASRPSIRNRLALWYGGILGGVILFLGILLYLRLSQNAYSDFDLSLRLTADALARLSLKQSQSTEPLTADDFLQGTDDPEFFTNFFRFYTSSGELEIRSKNHPKRTVPLSAPSFENALHQKATFESFSYPGRDDIRVMTRPVVYQGKVLHVLQVGGSLKRVDEVLSRLRFILFLTLPTALVVALIGGWFIADQALRPVNAMAQIARQITAGDLSRRIPMHPGEDELARLAETFNTMLSQLEESIQRIRQFSADASHELRTPLTILKGEAELALSEDYSKDEYKEMIVSSLEEIDRISRIVEDLFLLSKADLEEARLEMGPVPLTPLLQETVSQMKRLAADKDLSLEFDSADDPLLYGDAYRLRELFSNLIENAIRYTGPAGQITLSVSQTEEQIVINISDNGIGISPGDLPKIFDRFYRAESARALHPKGSGLGLSICQWIVLSHRGEIDVKSQPGQGTTFTLRFPLLR